VIYDRKVEDVPNWKRSVKSEHPPIEADTLEGLAAALELPASALAATVAEYNAACGDGAFKPLEVDRLSTRGLHPPKTNWARPIDKGPFGAYPIMSANCFTFGGLKVNSRAQVLDGDGRPIDGLYAAGEAMGLYHQVYTGATSVLRGAVFGRLAGLTQAELLGRAQSASAERAAARA
jgi:tricarballylate dehydrogenase